MGSKRRVKKKVVGRTYDNDTRTVEQTIAERFPSVESYRSRYGTVRVRIVDPRFEKKSRVQREKLVLPIIRTLPEEIQADLVMLLLLAPGEADNSVQNLEFDHPE
jgi:stress-induced morphogen